MRATEPPISASLTAASRRRRRPSFGWQVRCVSCVTTVAYFFAFVAPYAAHAQSADEEEPVAVELAPAASDAPAATREVVSLEEVQASSEEEDPQEPGTDEPDVDVAEDPEAERERTVQALPDGPAKSAVTPQAISLPNAEGSIEGMGESFSPNLSAGTGTFVVPIALPPGRAGVQPSLQLSYGTSGGNGPVGVGWSLGAPFIARQTDRGLPRYVDGPAYHLEEDRFIYNGGQELVPVDSAEAAAIDTGAIPAELGGWQQYRARVEGAFMRFFRSPDSLRWVVQDKNGMRFDFGLLDVGEGPVEAVDGSLASLLSEHDGGGGRIFQWNLTRMSDAHGSTVYYQYLEDGGARYLSDIFYLSPGTCASGDGSTPATRRNCTESLAQYGHRVHLVYEGRDDVFSNYVTTWRIDSSLRLRRIEITSSTALDDVPDGERTLVRRYHLRYDAESFISLLSELQAEGRPDAVDGYGVLVADTSIPESALGNAIVGRTLPPMRFTYSAVERVHSNVVDGFGGLDGTVHVSPSSPPHSVSEERADLFDVNSDGLPDLIVTDPAHYRTANGDPAAGVFFNGFVGSDATPSAAGSFSSGIPIAIPSGQSSVVNLANLNVNPMDVDGDGRSDLLHMPRVANYGYFTPTRAPDGSVAEVSPADQRWALSKRSVVLSGGELDPRLDFGRDGARIQLVDVNNDHLVDAVRTTGTQMQTFLNLGWLPGGEGRFGSFARSGDGWALSTQPIASCVLQLGLPVDFADPEVRLADMNGDGIQDIVKIRQGRVAYWPGRGPGLWGEGSTSCAAGQATGEGREIEMDSPPQELNAELASVFLSDVDMDGAADVVQVRYSDVDVWFNAAGRAFTERAILPTTPFAPGFAPRLRFADVDGSGTTDLLYANANRWQWLDMMGGLRPRLLVGVENGFGALTTLEYGSSAHEYLRDLADAEACADSSCERFTWSGREQACDDMLDMVPASSCTRSGGSPVISTVVTAIESNDQLALLGDAPNVKRTEFRYHDGYYEGIEQEFRGFGAADSIEIGDDAHPTAITRTHFDQGRRPGEIASDRLADNPNEARKGRTFLTEVFDEDGVYVSSGHASFTVRHLLDGLDGRAVSYGFVSRSDELRYDTGPFVASAGQTLSLPSVTREAATVGLTGFAALGSDDPTVMRVRSDRYAHLRSTFDSVDNLGHVLQQTAHGRVRGEDGEPLPDERIVTTTALALCNSDEWIWRVRHTYLNGHGDGSQRLGETFNTYSPGTCDLLHSATLATLPASGPYEFGGDLAGEALTQAAQTIEASTLYDAWGNARASCAGADLTTDGSDGCLRYGEVDYDDAYTRFPINERVATGPASARAFLSTSAEWDSGLGVVLQTIDPNGHATRLTYEGLGRLTSLTPPVVRHFCPTNQHPLTRITYTLSDQLGAPLNVVSTFTEQGCGFENPPPRESHVVFDGLGRTRAKLETAERDASGQATTTRYVRSELGRFTSRGTPREVFQPELIDATAPPWSLAVTAPAAGIPSIHQVYDAFGRQTAMLAEDGSAVRTVHHALATDVWDPNDLDPASLHYGTPGTERTDGHGRVIDQVLRNRQPGRADIEYHRLFTDFRADGKAVVHTRAQTVSDRPRTQETLVVRSGRPHVTSRQLFYDTASRRIASTDPDTDSRAPGATSQNRTWRYLYNATSDLVAVRDPRGCGQNFYYDHGGRLVAEHFVGCDEAQAGAELAVEDVPATAIALAQGDGAGVGADVRYYFDTYPSYFSEPTEGFVGQVTLPPNAEPSLLGRATGTADRAQRSVISYDAMGREIWVARQLAVIPEEGSALTTLSQTTASGAPRLDTGDGQPGGFVEYDVAHTYASEEQVNFLGQPTGLIVAPFAGVTRTVSGRVRYNARGLPEAAWLTVELPTFPQTLYLRDVIDRIEYTRDGLVSSIQYSASDEGIAGPLAQTSYDVRRRVSRMLTTRAALGVGNAAAVDPQQQRPLADVSIVVDQSLVWDRSNNLIEVFDGRPGDEWPDGFRPASYRAAHDALYRVANVELDYTRDDGSRTPFDDYVDYRDELAEVRASDPMQPGTAARLASTPDGRPASFTYEYDWLANQVESTDDAYQFYERSLGRISNGFDEDGGRPSALRLATDLERAPPSFALPAGSGDRGGYVEVQYGQGGNVEAMTVRAQCQDRDYAAGQTCHDPLLGISARLTYLRDNCTCVAEQHYQYRWDELNRLAEARRYDRNGGSGSWALGARQRYRYDTSNQRLIKQTLGVGGEGGTERIALEVFPGELERRGMVVQAGTPSRYEPAASGRQEDQYLVAGARVVWQSGGVRDEGQLVDEDHRVTVVLPDVLDTSVAVVDLAGGSVTEASTYLPGGGRESFRSADEADVGAEPLGFSGRESEEEVGLTYFGERWLIPRLQRWATPDPASVHALEGGEFGNSYHYVSGNLLQARDPWGLEGEDRGARTNAQWTAAREYGQALFSAKNAVAQASVEDTEEEAYANNPEMEQLEGTGWAYLVERDDGKFEWRFDAHTASQLYRQMDDKVLRLHVEKWFKDSEIGHGLLEVAETVDTAIDAASTAAGLIGGGYKGGKWVLKQGVKRLAKEAFENFAISIKRWVGLLCSFPAGTLVSTTEGHRPIEAVDVGDFVAGPDGGCAPAALDGWLRVSLRQTDLESGDVAEVVLLRPRSMVEEAGYVVGSMVPLGLPEAPAAGFAQVVDVRAHVAEIAVPAGGCPVTGTFKHVVNERLLSLRLEGRNDPLVVTGTHRLRTGDGGWKAADELRVGERLELRDGHARIARIDHESRAEREVYNLEVSGTHTYFVHEADALAHNGCRKSALKQFDLDRYGSFNIESRRGDGLDGHEILQNAWLEHNGGASRGVGELSRDNPAIALTRRMHKKVTLEQKKLGLLDPAKLKGMSAKENIAKNLLAMRRAGVPTKAIRAAGKAAREHAASMSK